MSNDVSHIACYLTDDHSRVVLHSATNVTGSDYINASTIVRYTAVVIHVFFFCNRVDVKL